MFWDFYMVLKESGGIVTGCYSASGKHLEEVVHFFVNLSGRADGAGDFRTDKPPVPLPQPVYRNASGSLRHPKFCRNGGVTNGIIVASQRGTHRLDPLAFSVALVLLLQPRQDA